MIPNKLKQSFGELIKDKKPRLNKNFVSCYFNDTSYAWLKFNDCVTGRGYLIKLPYSKSEKWSIYTSSLNNFDPKFNIEEGLIAYYDETFIWVQDMATGKRGKMLMNEKVMEIDHDNVHKSIDSLNVSRNKVWANLQIDGKWTVKEKAITLE